VLDLVPSVLSQEIDWEERLRNDLFCVELDVKPQLSQSTTEILLLLFSASDLMALYKSVYYYYYYYHDWDFVFFV